MAPSSRSNATWRPFHDLIRRHLAVGTRADGPHRTWTKGEFSHAIGVTVKTTNNWLRRGLPVSEDNLRGMLRVFFGQRHELADEKVSFAATFFEADSASGSHPVGFAAPSSVRKIRVGKLEQDLIGPHLFGREREQGLLDAAWVDPAVGVFSVFGLGGSGKSALVIRWWRERAALLGDATILGYTFGHQGLTDGQYDSASFFLEHALREWFGATEPPANSFEAGVRLAELIRGRPVLLMLDGLETLQFTHGPRMGSFKDPGMTALMNELAAYNPGLCVCTSRLPLSGLREGSKALELHDLPPETGAIYLRKLGVKGPLEDLRRAANEYGNHAFSLTNLAEYLNKAFAGDVRRRDAIPSNEESPASRLMQAYEQWFEGQPELEILQMLGLFDRPAESGAVERLRKLFPGLRSSHEWRMALVNCRDLKLLHLDGPDEELAINCHPIVRQHFGENLKQRSPALWIEGHRQLFDHYSSLSPPYPKTTDEIAPLYVAITHGCRAGCYEQALDVLRKRVWRDGEGEGGEHYGGRTLGYYSERALGLVSPDLAALTCFFEEPWERLAPGLSPADEASLLRDTAFRLRSLGRFHEAVAPMNQALGRFVAAGDWDAAALTVELVIEIYISLGDLANARALAEQAVAAAKRTNSFHPLLDATAILAFVLNKSGLEAETSRRLEEISRMLDENNVTSGSAFHQVIGCAYCDVLLGRFDYPRVLDHASEALKIAGGMNSAWLRAIGMHHWALGCAHAQRASAEHSKDYGVAFFHLDSAVETLRASRQQDYVPYALLARAEVCFQLGNLAGARRDVDEAFGIAEQANMRLHLADCLLWRARLNAAMKQCDEAHVNLLEAKRLIAAAGYRQRDATADDIEAQIIRLRPSRQRR